MQRNLDTDTKKYNKSLIFILLSVTLLLVITTYLDFKYKKENIQKHLVSLEEGITLEYKKRLEESVFNTVQYIDSSYKLFLEKQNNNSKILDEENYKAFEQSVRKYLYNSIFEKRRYTWINKIQDYKGGDNYAIRLIHPNLKNTEGTKLSTNIKDIKGNSPYLEELEGIKSNGEVFYSYYFKEYGSEKITKKISYAKLYKKLNWIVATGIPVNILESKIDEEKRQLLIKYENNLKTTVFLKLMIFLILLISVFVFRNKTTNYLFKNLSETNEILNHLNEKLSLATKSANIGTWKWDLKTNTLEWDSIMYDLYELEPKGEKDKYNLWANALHKDDKVKAESDLKNSIAQRKKFVSIFRINTKSGIKYIRAFGETTYDFRGNALYVVGVNFDVTNEKRQEKIILKQAQSLSDYVIYSRANEKGIITDVSNLFCKISGYRRNELIGKAHNIVRHPDMPRELFKQLWENLKNKKPWEGEIKNKRKDGSFYWVSSNIAPEYDEDGKFIGYISIRTDITERKDFEQKQIQMMEQAKLASLGEMIGNIAHQWRQPLSVISTAATGIKIQREVGALNDELLFNEVDTINNTAQHLSQTINTFRDFIKEDKIFTEVILQDRINNTLKILGATLQNNYIKLINNMETKEIEPVKVELIIGELSQVIMNIINNSKDALIANKIKEPTIILDIEKDDEKVVLTIEDNAGGIPEDIISHIYEPYFTTKHQSQGTGLGLYICHKIIKESLNGNIYVENTQIGAKTYIEIPLKASKN